MESATGCGDADLDLFVGDAGDPPALPARVVYFERSPGANVSFAAGAATGVTFGSGSLLVPALGDLDGDGDPDLLVGDDRGALSFLVRGYCSPEGPCSNNGLCAGAAAPFNEVSCECLVGFSGDQCDQCQGGYFGPACDICPEGGDEERSRPRITDTCGVKNSGRSRGTCDDAVTGSGACACFPPFSGPSCERGECPAGSLEVAESVGIFYFSACDDCAPGTYSSAGDALCAACDAGKYSGSGASACADCAPGTYSGAGAAACLPCAARSYAKAAGATSCVFAEPGSFVNETGASEQTACPAGTYSGSGAAACSDCEPGTYQDATGRPSCKRADGGSFVDAGGASDDKRRLAALKPGLCAVLCRAAAEDGRVVADLRAVAVDLALALVGGEAAGGPLGHGLELARDADGRGGRRGEEERREVEARGRPREGRGDGRGGDGEEREARDAGVEAEREAPLHGRVLLEARVEAPRVRDGHALGLAAACLLYTSPSPRD